MDLLEVGNLNGSRMGCHGNILLKINGGRKGRDRKPNLLGEEEAERQRQRQKV